MFVLTKSIWTPSGPQSIKVLLPPPVDLDECPNCNSVFSSLESEQRETSRLMKENKALVNGIFQLQTEVLLHSGVTVLGTPEQSNDDPAVESTHL